MIPWAAVWLIGIVILICLGWNVVREIKASEPKKRRRLITIWVVLLLLSPAIYLSIHGSPFAQHYQGVEDAYTKQEAENILIRDWYKLSPNDRQKYIEQYSIDVSDVDPAEILRRSLNK